MSNKKGLRCFSVVVIIGIVLTATLIVLYAFYLGPNLLEDRRADSVPPTVIVHSPSTEDATYEGDLLTASATAISRNPISRLEVWLDGVKFQEQAPQGSRNTLYASFEIEMTEGSHLLVFRAVDSAGLVGQSPPIPVVGMPGLATLVTDKDGQNLEDIAQALGEKPGDLQELNPDLGKGNLPRGTKVKVPKPPAKPEGGDQEGGPGDGGGDKDQPEPPPDTSKAYEVLPEKLPLIRPGDLISALIATIPKAPSSFYANYENCVVELHWDDNSENETHFNIWMQRVYGPPQLIATTGNNPKNGPTSFKFKAPKYGFYDFWVEAANSLNGQPSEIKGVFVSDRCGLNIATSLEIEALDMYVFAPYERIYCYLSLDGGEHRRIPEKGYIQVNNNWGDITKHWGGEKRILYPMPADEELTLSGTCLADLGPLQVSPFTNFKTSVPREKWDGSRLEIKTEAFLVGYRVQPHGPAQASGAFEYINYDLNPPDIWNVEAQGEMQIPEKDWKARTVTLTWGWEGDPGKITNFLILIDGKEIRYVDKTQRQESILMGSACGQEYDFQMVAVGPDGARSAPSNRRVYTQPPCPAWAEVHFMTIKSNGTDDTDCIPPFMHTCLGYTAGSCHSLGVWYKIWAQGAGNNRIELTYGSSQISIHYQCGVKYQFNNQLGATQDKIYVPIDPSNPEVRFGTIFWDSDDGGHDAFGVTDEVIRRDYNEWPSYDEIFTINVPRMNDTADATVSVRVRGFSYAGGSLDLYLP